MRLPRCAPRLHDGDESGGATGPQGSNVPTPLVPYLQAIQRPTDLDETFFAALGVHKILDCPAAEIVPTFGANGGAGRPHPFLPDHEGWSALPPESVRAADTASRLPLNNGRLSPGCMAYLERVREMSINNEDAFDAIMRKPVPKGKTPVRLGNAFEFYRVLETATGYWDDTSREPVPDAEAKPETSSGEAAANGEGPKPADANGEKPAGRSSRRIEAGSAMPVELRSTLLNSFIKLVAYDFGCNVSAPTTEPKLFLTSPPRRSRLNPPGSTWRLRSAVPSACTFIFRTPTTREAARSGVLEGPLAAVSARGGTSFTAPADENIDFARELVAALLTAQHRAREGRTEVRFGEGQWWTTKPRWGGGPGGPIGRELDMQQAAAEKARNAAAAAAAKADNSASESDASEGNSVERGATTAPLVQPSSGEILEEKILEEKVRPPVESSPASSSPAVLVTRSGGSSIRGAASAAREAALAAREAILAGRTPPAFFPSGPLSKRARRGQGGLSSGDASSAPGSGKGSTAGGGSGGGNAGPTTTSVYDNYRMLRPPSSAWDPKTTYRAFGRLRSRGQRADEIFVISSLFHHISVLRVTVPDALLAVLDGTRHDHDIDGNGTVDHLRRPRAAWDRLVVRRSEWFDLFVPEQRVEAIKLLWGVMAWLMRSTEGEEDMDSGNGQVDGQAKKEDVEMADA